MSIVNLYNDAMIITVATSENHLKAIVDSHFGRCDWYCLYDTETKKSSFIENPGRYLQQQAGCDAALFSRDIVSTSQNLLDRQLFIFT